jgi:hypothetical protein
VWRRRGGDTPSCVSVERGKVGPHIDDSDVGSSAIRLDVSDHLLIGWQWRVTVHKVDDFAGWPAQPHVVAIGLGTDGVAVPIDDSSIPVYLINREHTRTEATTQKEEIRVCEWMHINI